MFRWLPRPRPHLLGLILVALPMLVALTASAAPATVSFGSYFGGGSDDNVLAVTTDASGIYLTGRTYSDNLPGTSGPLNGSNDLFVAKLSPDGVRLLWAARIGGSGGEEGRAIVSDGKGAIYVTGRTDSPDFPTTPGVEQRTFGGFDDVVILRLDAATGATRWSTYFGQSNLDEGNGIALDSTGAVYVAGWWAQNDAVLLKFDAASGVGIWGQAWSQRDDARATALAIAPDGSIWVTGGTEVIGASQFEIVGPAVQPVCGSRGADNVCARDAFVTRLSGADGALLYSSFLGGAGQDEGAAIAVDPQGYVLVAGKTLASDFPTRNALQPTRAGAANFSDGFLARLTPDGSSLVYATYLGGAKWDEARALVVDEQGNATIAGLTGSQDFPTKDALQGALGDGVCELGGFERYCYDAFVTRVNAAGALGWSSYLGGGSDDLGHSLALHEGAVLVAGRTASFAGMPTSAGAFQNRKGFGDDGFLIRLGGDGDSQPPPGPQRVYLPLLRR